METLDTWDKDENICQHFLKCVMSSKIENTCTSTFPLRKSLSSAYKNSFWLVNLSNLSVLSFCASMWIILKEQLPLLSFKMFFLFLHFGARSTVNAFHVAHAAHLVGGIYSSKSREKVWICLHSLVNTFCNPNACMQHLYFNIFNGNTYWHQKHLSIIYVF